MMRYFNSINCNRYKSLVLEQHNLFSTTKSTIWTPPCCSYYSYLEKVTSSSTRFRVHHLKGRFISSANYTKQQTKSSKRPYIITTAAFIITSALGLSIYTASRPKISSESSLSQLVAISETSGDLFTRSQVREHNSLEKRVWITFGNGVYDITDFVAIHPGGDRILLAAGGPVEPFWSVFSVHASQSTRDLLSHYKIGELLPRDIDPSADLVDDKGIEGLKKLFDGDPDRDPELIVRSARPCNSESPVKALFSPITETRHHFVRNHLPVPQVSSSDEDTAVALTVTVNSIPGTQSRTLSRTFTLKELREDFEKVEFAATLQCAGNRRSEMHETKPVRGLLWERGAISTAIWGGVRLRDLISHITSSAQKSSTITTIDAPTADNWITIGSRTPRVSSNTDEDIGDGGWHVHVDGLDGYGASVPVEVALDPRRDVILAYEMNHEALTPDHGYPVRFIAPGHVAARSVKWVSEVTVGVSGESLSHWQRRDYKGFNPSKTLEESSYATAESIQEMPVQSAILYPVAGERVVVADDDASGHGGSVCAKGYAWSGGGRGIVRVDVSGDGGRTWADAKLMRGPDAAQQSRGKEWAWTHWEANVPIPTTARSDSPVVPMEIVCKAIDTSYNEQPASFDATYNVRGVLASAWHRVKMEAEVGCADSKKSKPDGGVS